MSTLITEFAQPDDTMPFGQHLKNVVKYPNIALPTFTRTFTETLTEEKRWRIDVHIVGRTFGDTTEAIDFFNAPTWSLGRSIAAHDTSRRICEEYHNDLEKTTSGYAAGITKEK